LSFWCPLETSDATNHLGPEDVTVPSTYTNVFLNTAVQQAGGSVFGTPPVGVSALQTTRLRPGHQRQARSPRRSDSAWTT
jgi:hypothetical protein